MDAAVKQVFHRMIAAAMAELEFEVSTAEGVGDQLVAQADAHDRFAAIDEIFYRFGGVIQEFRVTGTG